MKKRSVLALMMVLLALLSVFRLKAIYPELTWPVINNYSGDPAPTEKGSPYKIYYQNLDSVEKQAYNMIMEKIYDMPEQILVPDLTEAQLDNVFTALLFDNPDLFFLGRRCSIKPVLWNNFFQAEYIITKAEYLKQKAELETEVSKILAALPVSNTYNKELAIHNYIVDHTSYKIEDKQYVYSSVYGCLVNGVAACEGYSKAAKLLMDRCGIENYVISGTAYSDGEWGPHMWNVVNVDGNYYHLDITWDDPITNKGKNVRLYSYFNVTDSVIKATHGNFSVDFGCNADSSNYYKKNNLTFGNYGKEIEDSLGKAIYDQYKTGVKEIQINFENRTSYESAFNDLIKEKNIYKILKKQNTVMAQKISGYYENEDTYTLTFVFK